MGERLWLSSSYLILDFSNRNRAWVELVPPLRGNSTNIISGTVEIGDEVKERGLVEIESS